MIQNRRAIAIAIADLSSGKYSVNCRTYCDLLMTSRKTIFRKCNYLQQNNENGNLKDILYSSMVFLKNISSRFLKKVPQHNIVLLYLK